MSQPIPPLNVRPPTPVGETRPSGTERPMWLVAVSTSCNVAPLELESPPGAGTIVVATLPISRG